MITKTICNSEVGCRHITLQRLLLTCLLLVVVTPAVLAQPRPNLTGTWTGSFTSDAPPIGSGDSGPITVTFSQAQSAITGNLTVPGSSCVRSGGAISGQITRDPTSPSGFSITFGNIAVAGGVAANAITFDGTIDSATQLKGSF